MRYLPVYCAACAHASLSNAEEDDGTLRCCFCECPARVVPGPVFGDGDWLAFAEIDRAVYEADVDAMSAATLLAELQSQSDRQLPPQAIVTAMIERLPALARARDALLSQLPRGLRMLSTLLLARTRDEQRSGIQHDSPTANDGDRRETG
jgi:hypothetical protein